MWLYMQEARCIEEVQLQAFERQRCVQYYRHVSSKCREAADMLQQQAVDMRAAAIGGGASQSADGEQPSDQQPQQLLVRADRCAVQAVILRGCAKQYDAWFEAAVKCAAALAARAF
jgi:hypothetical protein